MRRKQKIAIKIVDKIILSNPVLTLLQDKQSETLNHSFFDLEATQIKVTKPKNINRKHLGRMKLLRKKSKKRNVKSQGYSFYKLQEYIKKYRIYDNKLVATQEISTMWQLSLENKSRQT